MKKKEGTVLYGINNIFFVRIDDKTYECRIKGKVLNTQYKQYNPLAPGDAVETVILEDEKPYGLILSRKKRRNQFERWNKKKKAPQTLAANVDRCICVTSPQLPPFRARFIDRVLTSCEDQDIIPCILVNKTDLEQDKKMKNHIENYKHMGYDMLFSSVIEKKGIMELYQYIEEKNVVFVGQSGVGKSTILNTLFPWLNLRIGEISEKYKRGRHTTRYAVLHKIKKNTIVIDTPGIKEFSPCIKDSSNLDYYFRDFIPYIGRCTFSSCTHVHEPNCAIKKAVEEQKISKERYQSYLSILEDIESKEKIL